MAGPEALRGWDLATWRLAELDASFNSSMLSVVEVQGRPSVESLIERISAAVAGSTTLRSTVVDLGPELSLKVLAEVDIRQQVKLLPQSSNLQRAAVELLSRPFAKGELLWRLRVIPGADSTYVMSCMSHAIADGVNGFRLLAALFDVEAPTVAEVHEGENKSVDESVREFLRVLLGRPQAVVRAIAAVSSSANSLLQTMTGRDGSVASREGELAGAWLRVRLPGRVPNIHHLCVAAAAAAFEAVAGGPSDGVHVNVPLPSGRGGRNRVVAVRMRISGANIADKIESSRQQGARWRSDPALLLADEVAELVASLPLDVTRNLMHSADLTVSTLPPLPALGQMLGSQVTSLLPLVPPVGAAANVTTVQIGRDLFVGSTWLPAALGETWPRHLRESLSEAFGLDFQPAGQ